MMRQKKKNQKNLQKTQIDKKKELEGHKFSGQDKTMCFTVMYLYLQKLSLYSHTKRTSVKKRVKKISAFVTVWAAEYDGKKEIQMGHSETRYPQK